MQREVSFLSHLHRNILINFELEIFSLKMIYNFASDKYNAIYSSKLMEFTEEKTRFKDFSCEWHYSILVLQKSTKIIENNWINNILQLV